MATYGTWEVSPVGRQIRKLRTDRRPKLTQEGLAARAGVSVDVIQRLEQGRKQSARLATLIKIADALEVDLAVLADQHGPPSGREAPGSDEHVPKAPGRASRPRRPNELIRRARVAIPSPSGSGRPMSRAELAEAVNAYLHNRGVQAHLNQDLIGRYERGATRWPPAHYRRGLRAVLGAETDAQLGLFKNHPRPSDEPSRTDEPGGWPYEATGAGTAGRAQPILVPSSPSPRVMLHWTGSKALALRIAMRMSVRGFAAKLGVNEGVVSQWRNSTGQLRYETFRMLDTMLSLATDDDVARFNLALREIGEEGR